MSTRVRLVSLVITLVVLAGAVPPRPPAVEAAEADFDVPGGRFFTQTGGGGGNGFVVTDQDGIRFWSEFKRLGGVQAVGYPASRRLEWDGFVVQVFQRVIFQWRPECGCVYFVNVFDRIHDLGQDDWLKAARQTPPPKVWAETGLAWGEIVRRRLAVLDRHPPIKAAYYAVVGDAVQANGLPTSDVVDMGNHLALRAQRVVLQQWKEDVPWAKRGQVTVALGGDIAKEAGVLPDKAALLPVSVGEATLPTHGKRTMAYYVSWDLTSWDSLVKGAEHLDYVGAQWVFLDACFNIYSRDDQTLKELAREKGFAVLPSWLTLSGEINHRILTDEPTTRKIINQIVAYVVAEGYPGFDLDLEGIDAGDRAAYTHFVERLAAALHARGKILTLAIPAKTREMTTGWAGAYDYAALGKLADLIVLMTYDFHGSWGSAGPVAPYDWVDNVLAYASRQIPPRKLLVGLAFYGYTWNLTTPGAPTRSLHFSQAAWLSETYRVPIGIDPASKSATFRYRAPAEDILPGALRTPEGQGHRFTQWRGAACTNPPPTPGSGRIPPPKPPTLSGMQEYVVWIEEAASAKARLAIADRHRSGGVAAWRLGQEDPRVWDVLREWRSR